MVAIGCKENLLHEEGTQIYSDSHIPNPNVRMHLEHNMAQKRLVEEGNLESVGLDVEDELGLWGWVNPRRKRALRELAVIGAHLESIGGDPLS